MPIQSQPIEVINIFPVLSSSEYYREKLLEGQATQISLYESFLEVRINYIFERPKKKSDEMDDLLAELLNDQDEMERRRRFENTIVKKSFIDSITFEYHNLEELYYLNLGVSSFPFVAFADVNEGLEVYYKLNRWWLGIL